MPNLLSDSIKDFELNTRRHFCLLEKLRGCKNLVGRFNYTVSSLDSNYKVPILHQYLEICRFIDVCGRRGACFIRLKCGWSCEIQCRWYWMALDCSTHEAGIGLLVFSNELYILRNHFATTWDEYHWGYLVWLMVHGTCIADHLSGLSKCRIYVPCKGSSAPILCAISQFRDSLQSGCYVDHFVSICVRVFVLS